MTSLPHGPKRRYTVEEFAALPVDKSARYELQEGVLVVSPRPALVHMNVIMQLGIQIHPQLPSDLAVVPEVEVHLEPLPATVRVPDIMIVRADVFAREQQLISAADVMVAVEILSPGSTHVDTVIKPLEYADAGIEHFWLIDPEPPVTATVYRLISGEYEESQRAEKVLEVDEPCPLRIDLDALLPAKLR